MDKVQVIINNTTITLNGSEAQEMIDEMINAGYYNPETDEEIDIEIK